MHLVVAAVLALFGVFALLDVDGISKDVLAWVAIVCAVLLVLVPYVRARKSP